MKIEKSQRFKSIIPLKVTCLWELDTAAILDDYTESCESTFPAGEELEVFRVLEDESKPIQCLVPNHKSLLAQMIPKNKRTRILCFPLPMPFDVLVNRNDLEKKCERVETER